MSKRGLHWDQCACKDCVEPALVQKAGGKSFCEDCEALGCPDNDECIAKHIALHDDVHPDSTPDP